MNDKFYQALQTALSGVAEPARAGPMRAYMRGQFDFLGIATPQRRLASKPLLRDLKGADAAALLDCAGALWDMPQREYQYVAIDLLAMHWKELDGRHIPDLLALAQRRAWWDSVDGLAGIVGDVLKAQPARGQDPHLEMDEALTHPDLWLRRIAMLHQLGWRQMVDAERLFSYALALAPEQEFFIQKAIGWALRDYARYDPAAVRRLLDRWRSHLPPLSYREANKHLL